MPVSRGRPSRLFININAQRMVRVNMFPMFLKNARAEINYSKPSQRYHQKKIKSCVRANFLISKGKLTINTVLSYRYPVKHLSLACNVLGNALRALYLKIKPMLRERSFLLLLAGVCECRDSHSQWCLGCVDITKNGFVDSSLYYVLRSYCSYFSRRHTSYCNGSSAGSVMSLVSLQPTTSVGFTARLAFSRTRTHVSMANAASKHITAIGNCVTYSVLHKTILCPKEYQ